MITSRFNVYGNTVQSLHNPLLNSANAAETAHGSSFELHDSTVYVMGDDEWCQALMVNETRAVDLIESGSHAGPRSQDTEHGVARLASCMRARRESPLQLT